MHYLVVENDYTKLAKQFDATIATEPFLALLARRLQHPEIKLSRGFEANFATDKKAQTLIEQFRAQEKDKAQKEIEEAKVKLEAVLAKLAKKETKTALLEKTRLEKKIGKGKFIVDKKPLTTQLYPYDQRIYPLSYAGLVVADGIKNVIKPYRFQIRPKGKDASFDKESRLYKAKRESLNAEYFKRIRYHAKEDSLWRSLFGKQHGILVVKSFFEYAGSGKSQGFGQSHDVLVPCLYDVWGEGDNELSSFALITDAAPSSVMESGYHRSPVALKEEYVWKWLRPEGLNLEELAAILADNEISGYTTIAA